MPFPWYKPDIPQELETRPDRAQQMYMRELRERAALLMRLGYSRDDTLARLRGNIRWDFELQGRAPHLDRVQEVVGAVYDARGLGGGGTPSLEA